MATLGLQVLADTSRHLNPTVLTVFSAPNYCDRYHNKAAVLHIEKLGYYTVNLLGGRAETLLIDRLGVGPWRMRST